MAKENKCQMKQIVVYVCKEVDGNQQNCKYYRDGTKGCWHLGGNRCHCEAAQKEAK